MPYLQLKQLSRIIHQTIVIGVAAIVAHAAQADGLMDDILALVENSTEAEIVSMEREIR